MTPKRLPMPPANRRPRFRAAVACAVLATIASPAVASAATTTTSTPGINLGVNLGGTNLNVGVGGSNLLDVNLTVPGINVPAATVPPITVPSVTVPPITTPVGTTPTITTPELTTPAVTTPELAVPGTSPTVSVPNLTIPGINVPPITVPEITVPSVTVPPITTPIGTTPAITTPSVTTPAVTTPAITTPTTTDAATATEPVITVPPITIPAITLPELPGISLPGITIPPITIPEITVPSVTVPPITTPVGTTPEISTPEVKSPAVTTPEITTPDLPTTDTSTQTGGDTPAATPTPTPKPFKPPVIRIPTGGGTSTNETTPTVDLRSDGNLRLDVGCAEGATCELVEGEIDLGNGQTIKLDPSTALGSADLGKLVRNLKIVGPDYTNVAGLLAKGKCVTVKFRVRVKTADGDEMKSFNAPICGSKVTFSTERRPVVTAEKATRRIKTMVSCTKACAIKPRFLLVKSGNKVLARIDGASRVSQIPGSSSDHSTIWKLSAKQEAAISRAVRHGSKKVRYVVSARASSGGIVTTGTASFRTRTK
ncbi:MAG: hypothetical protein Q7T55_22965 [Solirubrobacteraceae bacterium]|nr:hypothetical protein [Solirubrobacteraceae bacterium]